MDDYVKPKATRLTCHSCDQEVLIPKCSTKLFQFSYFNRIAKLWNTLPESTRTLSSLNQFKFHVLLFGCFSYTATNAVGHVIFY